MQSNLTLLQKADLDLAQIAAGGILQTQQAKQFMILAIEEPVMLGQVAVTPMTGPVEERDKMRFSGRVLRAGAEATALPLAARAVPALSLFNLTSVLYKAEVRITDEVLEDQIERGTFKNTVTAELAKAIGRDMEHVAINGDTTTVVTDLETQLLSTQDGWLALVNAHTVAGGDAQLNSDLLRNALTTLPQEWRRDRSMLRYFTNTFAEIRYTDDERGRMDGAGTRIHDGNWTPHYMKVPVVGVDMFPDNIGALSRTAVILSNPKNLVVGFQRKVKVELDRDVTAGVTIVVATVRFAVACAETDAAVRVDAVVGQ